MTGPGDDERTPRSAASWVLLGCGMYAVLVLVRWLFGLAGWLHDRDPSDLWLLPAVPAVLYTALSVWTDRRRRRR